MSYTACKFTLDPFYPFNEILIAELSDYPFESFTEEDQIVTAYIPTKDFDAKILETLNVPDMEGLTCSIETIEIPKENWNQKWEESFSPVTVSDFCIIRAPFHEAQANFKYELIIEPKMSFGTGHHATTQMMIEGMSEIDMTGKSVLDMGSGTGVLAILADKMGSVDIKAIDIEDWAFVNIKENIERNSVKQVEAFLGGAEIIEEINESYDLLLANINKNILLRDMLVYYKHMNEKSNLLLSGFFKHDADEIITHAEKLGLNYLKTYINEDWCCILFDKS